MSEAVLPRGVATVARFGVVGVSATLVHAAVLAILITAAGVWPPVANLTAFLVAFGVSYIGHRAFTFNSTRSHASSLPVFALVAAAGAAANFAVFVLFNDLLQVAWGWTFLISMAVVSPIVFALSRSLAFADDAPVLRLRALTWGPAGLMFLAAAVMTVLFHHPLPYFDHWDLVPLYDSALKHELTFADLFRPHGGHWHATGYMVMLTLARLTGMNHLAEVTASLVICLAGGIVLVRLCIDRAAAFQLARLEPWLVGLVAFFWFSLDQAPNFLWGWQVAVFLNTTGAVVVIAMLSRRTLLFVDVVVAAVAAATAIYAFATGLVLLPIGFLLIAAHRTDLRPKIVAAGIWAVFCAAILYHYYFAVLVPAAGYVAVTTPAHLGADTLSELIQHTLTFVGGAVGRFSDGLALPAAALGAVAALLSVWTLRKTEDAWIALIAPFVALCLYGLGSGLLTGYGRLGFGVEQALVSRYISFGNFYWMGIMGVMVLALGRGESYRAHRALLGLAGLFIVLKVANIANVVVSKNVADDHRVLVEAAAQIVAAYPVEAPKALMAVSAPGQNVQPRIDMLARDHLSLFRGAAVTAPAKPAP